MDYLRSLIRDIPDFPKPGIIFKDITPLLLDAKAFRQITESFVERYSNRGVGKIAAIEARGFMFAAPIAYELGLGFVPLRKPGKLPYDSISESYALEYGEAALELHNDAIEQGDKIVLFDDVLATGGTAAASAQLIERLGGDIIETGFVIELAFLKGREKLGERPVYSLLAYD